MTIELIVHHGFHGTLHFNQHPLLFTFGNTAKSNSYQGGEVDSGGKGKKKKKKVSLESVSMHTQNIHPNQNSCLLRQDLNCSHQYYSRGIITEAKELLGHRTGMNTNVCCCLHTGRRHL